MLSNSDIYKTLFDTTVRLAMYRLDGPKVKNDKSNLYEANDIMNFIKRAVLEILGNPDGHIFDIEKDSKTILEHLENQIDVILQESFLQGENRDLTVEEKSKLSFEKLAIAVVQSNNNFLNTAVSECDVNTLYEFYRNKKRLNNDIKKNPSKGLAGDYNRFLKLIDSNSETAIRIANDLFNNIKEVAKHTDKSIQDVIVDFINVTKIMNSIDIVSEIFEKYQEMQLVKNEIDKRNQKVQSTNDEMSKKSQEEREKEKKRVEAKNKKRKIVEKSKRELEIKRLREPFEDSDEIDNEYIMKMAELNEVVTAKESIIPVFIHIYKREEKPLFDIIKKSKMKDLVNELRRYEKYTRRKAKFFILTNQGEASSKKWMEQLDKFLQHENMQGRVEGVGEKYGSKMHLIEGTSVSINHMTQFQFERINEIIRTNYEISGFKVFLDDTEKDFLKFNFPDGKNIDENYMKIVYTRFMRVFERRKDPLKISVFSKENEKGFDILKKSQIMNGSKIYDYMKQKYYIDPNKGISFFVDKIDETINNIALRNNELEQNTEYSS